MFTTAGPGTICTTLRNTSIAIYTQLPSGSWVYDLIPLRQK